MCEQGHEKLGPAGYFARRIAERNGVLSEDVTPEWIMRKRESEVYPNAIPRYGDCTVGLIVFSGKDLCAIVSYVESVLGV